LARRLQNAVSKYPSVITKVMDSTHMVGDESDELLQLEPFGIRDPHHCPYIGCISERVIRVRRVGMKDEDPAQDGF